MIPFSGNAVSHEGLIPGNAGIGLRGEHYVDVLEQLPDVGWMEVHSENYFGDGGKPLYYLEQIRKHYPVSLHGVGLSVGSVDPLNINHLEKLKDLIGRVEPGLISEHLSWGSVDGRYLNDLLPMPYTEEALDHMVDRISQVQDYLGRQILIENASTYMEFSVSTIPEWEFVSQVAVRSGCGILLDVNNIYVNAMNHGFDAGVFIQAVPPGMVKEIHLAGHTHKIFAEGDIRIDTHNKPVCAAVWSLYRQAVQRFGAVPSLIEWDTDLPSLDFLVEEAHRANDILVTGSARVSGQKSEQKNEHVA